MMPVVSEVVFLTGKLGEGGEGGEGVFMYQGVRQTLIDSLFKKVEIKLKKHIIPQQLKPYGQLISC